MFAKYGLKCRSETLLPYHRHQPLTGQSINQSIAYLYSTSNRKSNLRRWHVGD